MKLRSIFSIIALSFAFTQFSFGQAQTGSIYGTVTDVDFHQTVKLQKGKNLYAIPQQNAHVQAIVGRDLQIEKVLFFQGGKSHKMKIKRDGRYHYKDVVVDFRNTGNTRPKARQKNRRVEMTIVFE